MAEHFLDRAQIRAALQHVRGAGVPESVRVQVRAPRAERAIAPHERLEPTHAEPFAQAPEEQCARVLRASARMAELACDAAGTRQGLSNASSRAARCALFWPCRALRTLRSRSQAASDQATRAHSLAAPSHTVARARRRLADAPRPGPTVARAARSITSAASSAVKNRGSFRRSWGSPQKCSGSCAAHRSA